MAVRAAPTSEHFILQGTDTPHHICIASNKLFKDFICFCSSKVRLVGVAPHVFFTSIILHIFMYITSNIFMVIMMNPFVERHFKPIAPLESILLSLDLSNTFEDGWSHGVASCSAWVRLTKVCHQNPSPCVNDVWWCGCSGDNSMSHRLTVIVDVTSIPKSMMKLRKAWWNTNQCCKGFSHQQVQLNESSCNGCEWFQKHDEIQIGQGYSLGFPWISLL